MSKLMLVEIDFDANMVSFTGSPEQYEQHRFERLKKVLKLKKVFEKLDAIIETHKEHAISIGGNYHHLIKELNTIRIRISEFIGIGG